MLMDSYSSFTTFAIRLPRFFRITITELYDQQNFALHVYLMNSLFL
jgi:hypothetical protein